MRAYKSSLAIAIVVLLLIDIFFGKALLRMVHAPGAFKSQGLRIPHEIFHHALAANYSDYDEWGVPYPYCTDTYGFRVGCGSPRSDSKTFDYVLMGDSMAEGLGLPYEQTIAGVFQRLVTSRVANFSVSSYAPTIHLEKYKYFLAQGFEIKNIVLFLDISDIEDEAVVYTRRQDGSVADRKETPLSTAFERRLRSQIQRLIPLTWQGLNALKRIIKNMGRPKSGPWSIQQDRESARAGWTYLFQERDQGFQSTVVRGFDSAVEAIKDIADIAQRRGTKVYVVLYPWPHQIAFEGDHQTLIERWSKNAFHGTAVSVLNLFPVFRDERQDFGRDALIEKYFIPGDTHLSAQGSARIAELLQAAMRGPTVSSKEGR